MGKNAKPKTPIVIEIDRENKNMDALEIDIPVLSPRIYREYKDLTELDVTAFDHQKLQYRQFSKEEQREIVFRDITTGEITHTTKLDEAGTTDYRSVIGYFTQMIMKDLRLVSGYDVLYEKVKTFVLNHLFTKKIELDHANTLRNLSELAAMRTLIEAFKISINALTVHDKGGATIRETIKLGDTRPFLAKEQDYVVPRKSLFNRIIGDSGLELDFAKFLDEDCDDIIAYAKNYLAVRFKLDYVKADGNISHYYPDFIVKASERSVFIVETKGREELDLPLKMARLQQWCEDVNAAQSEIKYDFIFIDEKGFNEYRPTSFSALATSFREYKNGQQ